MKKLFQAALVALMLVPSWGLAQDDDSLGVKAFLCEEGPILIKETAEGLEWNIDGRTVERRGRDFAIYEETDKHVRVYLNRLEGQIWNLTTVDFGDVYKQTCQDVTGLVLPISEYTSGLAMGQVSELEQEIERLRRGGASATDYAILREQLATALAFRISAEAEAANLRTRLSEAEAELAALGTNAADRVCMASDYQDCETPLREDRSMNQTSDRAGPPLTGGEKDAFRNAMNLCFSIGSLSTDALGTTVVVGVEIEQTGRPLTETIRMVSFSGGSEAAARQAFEAARRAIIRCGARGFPLPVEKYAEWRYIEMTFNPEGMQFR